MILALKNINHKQLAEESGRSGLLEGLDEGALESQLVRVVHGRPAVHRQVDVDHLKGVWQENFNKKQLWPSRGHL